MYDNGNATAAHRIQGAVCCGSQPHRWNYCLLRETNTQEKIKKEHGMQLLIGKSAPSKIGSFDTNLRHNRWQQVGVIPLFHKYILSTTFEYIVGIMTVQPSDGYLMHTRNRRL
ncbi:3609_t:CDS:2 [Acaulospora morrowiae]|uniref:3609_t:CDS:1 n=1 Tax=Acaulospora morrowiae TaxID=94023 RepID=A0A9N9AIG1_9GLOM|nr:3609_t:CDS:2 [Acaulospora morrowiae]